MFDKIKRSVGNFMWLENSDETERLVTQKCSKTNYAIWFGVWVVDKRIQIIWVFWKWEDIIRNEHVRGNNGVTSIVWQDERK